MNLKQRIVQQIRTRGPMPFERFMELSLYDPEGFFGGDTLRSEKAGDFLTSPEVSSMFGGTLASFVRIEHERIGDPFRVVEVAAGSGSLLRPLLREYPVDALAVEASPAARQARTGLVEVSDRIPNTTRGVVIANELIDNLPMALAQKVGDGWRERWVGLEGSELTFLDAPPRPEVTTWLEAYGGDVTQDGWVEVQLMAEKWFADVIAGLEAGAIVIIDYGDTADGLLNRRMDGTLRTYRSHHLGPHPLAEPGETDITADVNFTALIDIATRSGAEVQYDRQDDFLASLGLRKRLSELRKAELDAARSGEDMERLRLRTAKTEVETLLHPRGLGDFRVLVARK